MAQLRYECSHCTKLSCNHAAATQHNRDAHGGQANILPERSKAQMRVNDFEQRAEIARLRALSTLSPIAAAAWVLLADDVAISRMAEAIHDGPLGAEGHWFSAATEQGGWCVDVVRAGLRALAEQEKADE